MGLKLIDDDTPDDQRNVLTSEISSRNSSVDSLNVSCMEEGADPEITQHVTVAD